MNNKRMHAAIAAALLLFAGNALAQLKVFACEPEWGALIEEIGGPQVEVYVATTARQDPHYIQARPSLIAQMRGADLLVCTGAELEVGWLPLLLRRSAERQLQPGGERHFLAADHVRRLEVPTRLDRAEGDIHPQGNPHLHLDPNNLRRIARALADRLMQIDAEHAQLYAERLGVFDQRWRAAQQQWETAAESLHGMPVISQHRSFSYLANWLDLNVLATIEPKPGIPPSGAHLARLLREFGDSPPKAIIRTPYEDPKSSNWLAERLDIPVLTLPYTVGPDTPDLFALFDQTIDALRQATQ